MKTFSEALQEAKTLQENVRADSKKLAAIFDEIGVNYKVKIDRDRITIIANTSSEDISYDYMSGVIYIYSDGKEVLKKPAKKVEDAVTEIEKWIEKTHAY